MLRGRLILKSSIIDSHYFLNDLRHRNILLIRDAFAGHIMAKAYKYGTFRDLEFYLFINTSPLSYRWYKISFLPRVLNPLFQ